MRTTVAAVKLPSLWGKLQTRVVFKLSQQVVMPFRAAGVSLCDILCFSQSSCERAL